MGQLFKNCSGTVQMGNMYKEQEATWKIITEVFRFLG